MNTTTTNSPRTGNDAHTPTPWHTDGRSIVAAPTSYLFPTGNKIGEVYWNSVQQNSPEADAAFIVRAVNSHAALVAALEDILPRYEAAIRDTDNGFGQPLPSEVCALAQARSALAAARNA